MSKLSIVVPIYKNEKNIIPFYDDFCDNIKPYLEDYEIVMVNDGSPDDSWAVMKAIAKRDKKVKIIKLSRNFGENSASFTGIQYSTGDCVTVRAADLQEPAGLILDMYQKWKQGAKAVIGVRESREDPVTTKMFSAIYYWLVRKLVIRDMPLAGFDIYFMDRVIADQIIGLNDRNSPITLQMLWLGSQPEEVLYERRKRAIGKSSWTFSKKMKLFIDSFVGFSYIPIRIISVVGIIFAFVALVWGIDLIIARLRGNIPIQGYTTILAVVLFSAGLIMFTLGVLGEYIWRILDAVRRRPVAIVDEIINIESSR